MEPLRFRCRTVSIRSMSEARPPSFFTKPTGNAKTLIVPNLRIQKIRFSFGPSPLLCVATDMGLKIFNTLSRSVQEFVPLDPGRQKGRHVLLRPDGL